MAFFREVVNMAVPIFVPEARLLARQPLLWWLGKVGDSIGPGDLERMANPPRPAGFDPPQPSSPFATAVPEGPERRSMILHVIRVHDVFLKQMHNTTKQRSNQQKGKQVRMNHTA